ncbi:hypothetical protein ACU686_23795 [Yinghuangia aomiensis]
MTCAAVVPLVLVPIVVPRLAGDFNAVVAPAAVGADHPRAPARTRGGDGGVRAVPGGVPGPAVARKRLMGIQVAAAAARWRSRLWSVPAVGDRSRRTTWRSCSTPGSSRC